MVPQVDRRLALSGVGDRGRARRRHRLGQVEPVQRAVRDRPGPVGVRRPTTATAGRALGRAAAEDLLDWLQVPRRHGWSRRPAGTDGLDGLVLLDLPDHDSTELSHRLQVDRLVQLVDVMVWVVDPQKYADAALHERYLRPLAEHAE